MNQATKQQIEDWKPQIIAMFEDLPTDSLSQWNDEFKNFVKVEQGRGSDINAFEVSIDFELECDHQSHAEFETLSTRPSGAPDDLEPRDSEVLVCEVCGMQYDEWNNEWV